MVDWNVIGDNDTEYVKGSGISKYEAIGRMLGLRMRPETPTAVCVGIGVCEVETET